MEYNEITPVRSIEADSGDIILTFLETKNGLPDRGWGHLEIKGSEESIDNMVYVEKLFKYFNKHKNLKDKKFIKKFSKKYLQKGITKLEIKVLADNRNVMLEMYNYVVKVYKIW